MQARVEEVGRTVFAQESRGGKPSQKQEAVMTPDTRWVDDLQEFALAHNSRTHGGIGCSPTEKLERRFYHKELQAYDGERDRLKRL